MDKPKTNLGFSQKRRTQNKFRFLSKNKGKSKIDKPKTNLGFSKKATTPKKQQTQKNNNANKGENNGFSH